MPMAAFDTMSVAKRLQDDFEMPQKQAEGVALVLHENFVGNVATKEDVKGLKDDTKALKNDVKALKNDVKALDKKIDISVKALNDKIDISVKALNDKIDTSVKALNDKIVEVKNDMIEVKSDLRWIKLIGGAIVGLLVLPLLADLATAVLN